MFTQLKHIYTGGKYMYVIHIYGVNSQWTKKMVKHLYTWYRSCLSGSGTAAPYSHYIHVYPSPFMLDHWRSSDEHNPDSIQILWWIVNFFPWFSVRKGDGGKSQLQLDPGKWLQRLWVPLSGFSYICILLIKVNV